MRRKTPPWLTCLGRFSERQWLIVFLLLCSFCVVFFIAFNELIPTQFRSWVRVPPKVDFCCTRYEYHLQEKMHDYERQRDSLPEASSNLSESAVLVLLEHPNSRFARQITEALESARFQYKLDLASKRFTQLLRNPHYKNLISVIIYENLSSYFRMERSDRRVLEKFCNEHQVGIIGFSPEGSSTVTESTNNLRQSNNTHQVNRIMTRGLEGSPVLLKTGYHLKDYQLSANAEVLRIARPGSISLGPMSVGNWTVFEPPPHNSAFAPVAQALPANFVVDTYPGGYRHSNLPRHAKRFNLTQNNNSYRNHLLTTVLQDNGSHDGVRKVLFGSGLTYWLHELLLLDALTYLTNGRFSLPLKRYVQIDIDDIFVGERGTRLRAPDVLELVNFQKRLQAMIPDFQFNLGFSGKYYHRGYPEENEGDDMIIKNAHLFRWFCHMYSHSQAHITNNLTHIETEMLMNQEFAKAHSLPVQGEYIVSPHHSGVYPVHEPLYEAWKRVWQVRVSSTEEYPHLRPASLRRGFIHDGIMILPRQTCGLYTHTIFIDKYPGGRDKLEKSIFGGDLFYSFVRNQVNIFMTHQSNYANDRLALYAFESVVKFVQCWTNLQLFGLPPLQMAQKYFEIYPEDRDPLWTNPCDDKRHYSIWSPSQSCLQFPKFLILGPQKTGSTALATFLALHPSVINNLPSNETFEELQFFSGRNYQRGINWYLSFFPLPDAFKPPNTTLSNTSNATGNSSIHPRSVMRNPPPYRDSPPYFFEKSSTYFDGEQVPRRVHSLLPHAQLVVILIDPVRRAYSWYHHMRAHNHSVALNFTFHQVVTLDLEDRHVDNATMKKLKDLRARCLIPGHYSTHLERWLTYFPSQQISFVDGDELRIRPITVMDKLQSALKLERHIDYIYKLRFDLKKGFYCAVKDGHSNRCLGKSKGRDKPEMEKNALLYLKKYYNSHNMALRDLLDRLRVPLPSWLELELSNHDNH